MTLHPIPPDRATWLALRDKRIGASEVAALYDLQPDYAPGIYALWMHKAGRAPLPEVTGERVEWGLRNEAAIAAGASIMGGWILSPGLYASHDAGLGATLDRIAEAPDTEPLDLCGDNEAEDAAARYLRLSAEKKRIESEIAEAKNVLLEKGGAHKSAFLNGFSVSFVHQAEKAARPAQPGEMIGARAASVSIRVKEFQPHG
jgi:hypothetical protein